MADSRHRDDIGDAVLTGRRSDNIFGAAQGRDDPGKQSGRRDDEYAAAAVQRTPRERLGVRIGRIVERDVQTACERRSRLAAAWRGIDGIETAGPLLSAEQACQALFGSRRRLRYHDHSDGAAATPYPYRDHQQGKKESAEPDAGCQPDGREKGPMLQIHPTAVHDPDDSNESHHA